MGLVEKGENTLYLRIRVYHTTAHKRILHKVALMQQFLFATVVQLTARTKKSIIEEKDCAVLSAEGERNACFMIIEKEYLSDTHKRFFNVMKRLKKMSWNKMLVDIKPPEAAALGEVYEYEQAHPESAGIYVSALADKLKLPLPAMSKLLKSLEQRELVTRSVDPANRRNTYVSLTAQGLQVLDCNHKHFAEIGDRIFAQMGEEEVNTLLGNLNHLIDLLEQELE